MRWLPILLLISACGPAKPDPDASGTLPPDELGPRWAVFEARDHRNTAALCAFLQDSSVAIRRYAALALASVQDSASRPCLIAALKDPEAIVRKNAAFGLGWIADSTTLILLNAAADVESDTAIQRAMYQSGFRAELALRKHDALFLISYLESNDQDIRTRAAQQLARLPKEELITEAPGVLHAISVEKDPVVRMFLVGALKHNATQEVTKTLRTLAEDDSLPKIRVAALRALGAKQDNDLLSFLLDRLSDTDAGVQQTVLEQIQRLQGPLDGSAIWKVAQEIPDYSIKIPMYGMAMKYGDDGTRRVCRALMASMAQQDLGPYLNASLTNARYADSDTARGIMLGGSPAVVRQAAMGTWLEHFADALKTKDVPKAMRDQTHRTFMHDALTSGDAGIIAAACERILEEDQAYLKDLLDAKTVEAIRGPLHPIRDLETLQYLDQAIAKRDGKPAPEHRSPPFNHPIDRARLAALKQGQQYRIATTKGEIILAIEPDAAPGTCVAFDSLVTAGYYNGKYFHRVIPNFVAQGGCPRGDGYGGMPWTLRTEIGPEGFVEGAVGVASAGHDTESCQFFIMLAPAPHLDGKYTRFAHVASGLDVARRLQVGDVMTRVESDPLIELLRPHLREQQHLLDRGIVGEQHHQAVQADADATGGRHAVLQRAQEVLVDEHGFVIAALLQFQLLLEALALIDRVVQLAVRIGQFEAVHEELEALGEALIVAVLLAQRAHLHREVHHEGGLDQFRLHQRTEQLVDQLALAHARFNMDAVLAQSERSAGSSISSTSFAGLFLDRPAHGDALERRGEVDACSP
jgi:cyclophilin family peptidyl-prolyl cis-trans isomerase/HEAT repeat protein